MHGHAAAHIGTQTVSARGRCPRLAILIAHDKGFDDSMCIAVYRYVSLVLFVSIVSPRRRGRGEGRRSQARRGDVTRDAVRALSTPNFNDGVRTMFQIVTACQRRGSLALVLAASLAACGTSATGTATGPADFTADTGGDATTVDAPRIVSRITTGEGATVTFFNERDLADDPVISIAITSPDATPVMDALLAQRPSALELYRALQPAKAAPDELVREHRLLA